MTLTELKYVTAIARLKHFGRAAEACCVSQPSLSVAVKKLEEELGVVLFERNRSDVTITPIGERVVAQARLILENVEKLEAIAADEQDQLAAPLKLGVIYTVGPYLLPALIPELKSRAPQMRLLINEDFTDSLAERLKSGDLDAAILSLPFERSGITAQHLYEEPFVLALPLGHRLEERQSVAPADLEQETLLLLTARNCFRDQVLEACPFCLGSTADSIEQSLEGSSIETIRQMTALGAGVTILPITSTGKDNRLADQLVIKPFAEPAPGRTIVLAYRRTFPRPHAIAALAAAIRAAPPAGVRVMTG